MKNYIHLEAVENEDENKGVKLEINGTIKTLGYAVYQAMTRNPAFAEIIKTAYDFKAYKDSKNARNLSNN
jgi:hypothetical protein